MKIQDESNGKMWWIYQYTHHSKATDISELAVVIDSTLYKPQSNKGSMGQED